MTRMYNRGLSLLLAVCMVMGLIPMVVREAEAASNIVGTFEGQDSDIFTALGFDTSVTPEGYDAETTDNPTGKEISVGNQVFELIVSAQGGSAIYGYDDNTLDGSTVKDLATENGAPFYMFSSASADFDGDGLPGELVYVGFHDIQYMGDAEQDGSGLYICFADAEEGTLTYGHTGHLSDYVTPYYTTDNPSELTIYDWAWQNLLQVTAGDYDGDGCAEVAVYVAEKDFARVDIYKYQKTSQSPEDGWLDSSAWGRVWSYALSGPGDSVPNMVSLVTGDLNRDGVDDLGISCGRAVFTMTDMRSGDITSAEVDASSAVILWGAKSDMLQTSYDLDLNESQLGKLARVSLTTGDLDGDGYRELIATGQSADELRKYTGTLGEKLEAGNKTRSATTYIYDSEMGLVINFSGSFAPVDGEFVTADIDGESKTSWKGNGFDNIYYSTPLMRTNAAVFTPADHEGTYLYLDSCLYESTEGQLQLKVSLDDKQYDGENTLGGSGKWARSDLSSSNYVPQKGLYAEYGAASEDMNGRGNTVLTIASYSNTSYATRSTSSVMGNSVTRFNNQHSGGYSVLYGKDGILYSNVTTKDAKGTGGLDVPSFSPVFVDIDIDTTLIEYTGIHYLTYSDPKVLAIIAAAPYFEDIDKVTDYNYGWQNTTTYSRVNGEGKSESVSVDLEYGDYFYTSITGGGGNASLEGSVNFTLEWTDETVNTTEYTLTFETSQDEDSVAFFSIPTENYIYRVSVPDGEGGYNVTDEVVSRTFTPCYQVLNLDYYESIRENYKSLPAVRGEAIESVPGDPSSYPTSSSGYSVIKEWNDYAAGAGFGNGSITQEIAITKETIDSFNLGCALDFKYGGGVELQSDFGQAKIEIGAGAQWSLNPSEGWADINITGSIFTGTVTNMPEEFREYGYYYSWKLFAYNYKLDDDSSIPVVSYIVNDVSEPPRLPDDFEQDVERTTYDTNVLTWTYDGDFTNFLIYRYFDFPVGGGIQLIETIPSSTANYRVKYDEDGKLYKEYFFEDTNLSPYSEYEYTIQVERLSQTPPLSSPSAIYVARTKARDGYPQIPISESDGDDDLTLLVYPDKNAYLTVNATGPDGEKSTDYYTTVQYQWQKKDKAAWEEIVGETGKTLTFAAAGVETEGEYRCLVNVLTKEDNVAISTYTKPVTVTHSKRTAYISELYAGDLDGGVELFAKVSNAHTDSGTAPSGIVTFTVTDNATGKEYQTYGELSAEGIALKVISSPLPEGMYTVEAVYSGSFIFTSAEDEAFYMSQLDTGYIIDAPDTVIYGDGAELQFLRATKEDGKTVTEKVNASGTSVYYGIKVQRRPISGAVAVSSGETLPNGPGYYRDSDGNMLYFDNTDQSLSLKAVGVVGDYLTCKPINSAANYVTSAGDTGIYRLSEKTPVHDSYVVAMLSQEWTISYTTINLKKRDIVLQLPSVKGAEGAGIDPVYLTDLEVLSGSFAPIDLSAGTYSTAEVPVVYTNTAGTTFTSDRVTGTCGYYVAQYDSSKSFSFTDSYNVTFRPGSLAVIGAMHDVTIGAKLFEGLAVGTVYAVYPQYESTRDQLVQQYPTGTRIVFTAVPDDGYEIYDWYINGIPQGTKAASIAHVLLNEDTSVAVQFAIKQNSLSFGTAGDEGGGQLVCTDESLTSGSYVLANSRFRFEAVANEGYHFKEWRYSEIGTGTVYHTEDNGADSSFFDLLMPGASVSLYAVFERDFFSFEYEDRSENDGLTAWYMGTPTTDSTAVLEKLYIESGDTVKGDTIITVEAAPGYEFDSEYRYVSEGVQGSADYTEGTYTLTLTEDTKVTGYTYRKLHDVTVNYNITAKSSNPVGAGAEYSVDGAVGAYTYTEETPQLVLSDQNGGSDVELTVTYPEYYELKGWTDSESAITASKTANYAATLISFGSRVNAGEPYRYAVSSGWLTTEYYFTAPYDGVAEWSDGKVTIYRTDDTYTVEKLDRDESVMVHLVEKDLFTVNLGDITGDGEYIYSSEGGEISLPAGAILENVKETDGKLTGADITVHRGDTLTLMVNCDEGRTVSYWQATPESGQSRLTRATALKYTIPAITENFEFRPIFSSSTYNTVLWTSISEYQNNTTLVPEDGYIASVASGNDFRFTLTGGGVDMIEAVYGNGIEFTGAGNTSDGHTYRIENGVYIIENITANQTVTLKMRSVGVKVGGVDVSTGSGSGWTYDQVTQTLSITRSGLTVSGTNRGDFDATRFNIVTGTSVAGITFEDLRLDLDRSDTPALTVKSSELMLTVRGDVRIDGDNDYDDYTQSLIKTSGSFIVTGDGYMELYRWVGPDYVQSAKPMVDVGGDFTVLGSVELKLRSEANNSVLNALTNSADSSDTLYNVAVAAEGDVSFGQKDADSFPTVNITADGKCATGIDAQYIYQYGGLLSVSTVGGKPATTAERMWTYGGAVSLGNSYTAKLGCKGNATGNKLLWFGYWSHGYASSSLNSDSNTYVFRMLPYKKYFGGSVDRLDIFHATSTASSSYKIINIIPIDVPAAEGLTLTFDNGTAYSLKLEESYDEDVSVYLSSNGVSTTYNNGSLVATLSGETVTIYERNLGGADLTISGVSLGQSVTVVDSISSAGKLILNNAAFMSLDIEEPHGIYISGRNMLISPDGVPISITDSDGDAHIYAVNSGEGSLTLVGGVAECMYADRLWLHNLAELRMYGFYGDDNSPMPALYPYDESGNSQIIFNDVVFADKTGETEVAYGAGWEIRSGTGLGSDAKRATSGTVSLSHNYLHYSLSDREAEYTGSGLVYNKDDLEASILEVSYNDPVIGGLLYRTTNFYSASTATEDVARVHLICPDGTELPFIPYAVDFCIEHGSASNGQVTTLNLISGMNIVNNVVNPNYYATSFAGMTVTEALDTLPLGDYVFRLYFHTFNRSEALSKRLHIDIPLKITDNRGSLTLTTDQESYVTPGSSVVFNTDYLGATEGYLSWSISGNTTDMTALNIGENGSATLNIGAEPNGTVLTVTAKAYFDPEMTDFVTERTMDITVVTPAIAVEISNGDGALDGEVSLERNIELGEAATMQFTAAVALSDGTEADEVLWSLWGNVRADTTVDSTGLLSVSPKETGTGNILKLTATYENIDGTSMSETVTIYLKTGAKVSYVTDVENGNIAYVSYGDGATPVSAEGTWVPAGEAVTATAAPDRHYKVKAWCVNGKAVAEDTDTMSFTTEEMGTYEVSVSFEKILCTVSLHVGANGYLTVDGVDYTEDTILILESGAEISVQANPDEGYGVKSATVQGAFTVSENAVISAEFDLLPEIPVYYTIGITAEGMGEVNVTTDNGAVVANGDTVPAGTVLTVTSTAADGFLPAVVSVNGFVMIGRSFKVNSDTEICFIFESAPLEELPDPVIYTVTYDVVGSGIVEITANGEPISTGDEVYAGSPLAVKATAADGYYTKSITVNGLSYTGEGYVITTDTYVVVTFAQTETVPEPEPVTYEVSLQVKGEGSVTLTADGQAVASGDRVSAGTTLSISYTAADGYELDTASANGMALIRDSYTVNGDVEFIVTFSETETVPEPEPVTYEVSLQVKGEGSVTLTADGQAVSSGDRVLAGTTLSISYTAADGYELDAASANGMALIRDSYTVNGDVEFIVTFAETETVPEPEPVTYEVSLQVKGEGSVALTADGKTVASGDRVLAGTTLSISYTAADGYGFSSVTVNGLILKDSTYIVNSDSLIMVAFEKDPEPVTYALQLEIKGEGDVAVTADGSPIALGDRVAAGTMVTVTATPVEGSKLVSLTIGGTEHENGYSYSVYANTKIEVVFDNSGASGGLPYYLDATGNKVFIGLSYDLNSNGVIDDGEYIAPEGVQVLFAENVKEFDDTSRHWGEESISFVTERELFLGTSGKTFNTDGSLTRGMFVTIIGRLYERSYGELEDVASGVFTDCDYSDYYGKYVGWAHENDIINGYGNGRFGPKDPITREQMAVLLYKFARFMGRLPSSLDESIEYTDADEISDWAMEGVLFCQTTGLIEGVGNGMFSSKRNAKRVEMAVVSIRLIEYLLK